MKHNELTALAKWIAENGDAVSFARIEVEVGPLGRIVREFGDAHQSPAKATKPGKRTAKNPKVAAKKAQRAARLAAKKAATQETPRRRPAAFRCGTDGCDVVSTPGGLGAHQYATGHEGRIPVVAAA